VAAESGRIGDVGAGQERGRNFQIQRSGLEGKADPFRLRLRADACPALVY
jgi:hypothetical protein